MKQLSRAAPTGHEWSVQFVEAVLADSGVAEALPAKINQLMLTDEDV